MMVIADSVKNILFDFGGVIINLNIGASIAAFSALRGPNAPISFEQWSEYSLEPAFERGELSPAEFCGRMRVLLNNPVSDQQIHAAWNAMILDIPPHRIKALEALKNHYRIFLLSNTSEIHYQFYTRRFVQQYGYKGWEALFERAWFSHHIGLRKPDPAIFNYILEEKELHAEETLFIDDSKANTDAAASLGFQVLHLASGIDWA
ncbi:MAG: HAD family phosphatase [Bacteroidales bacterium]|nr:HAD family phosphatase [Bacteroidales bacterium]MDY0285664.1 HAD family phosphatase [Bacteroidales bacterium]HPE86028.1 HAD family phosphatase [Bacteroidales bacterium]